MQPSSKDDLQDTEIIGHDAAGGAVYVPGGTANLFTRTAYLAPTDPEGVARLIRAHRRLHLVLLTVLSAGAVLLAAAILMEAKWTARLDIGLVIGAFLAAWVFASTVGSHAIARRFRLEKSNHPWKAPIAKKNLGSGPLLLTIFICGLAAVGIVLWLFSRQIGAGNAQMATLMLFVVVPGIGMVPAIILARRARILEMENVKLEAIVADRTRELRELNANLEQRVKDQVTDIERLGQLKHFFAAPVAEMILSEKRFDPSRVHRRELTAISLDLRGFTAFSETSEPEEVIGVLRIYHAELGILVTKSNATLEHFAGDGVMLFMNDPVEIENHPLRAVELALALRSAMQPHLEQWRASGFDLGLGIGIATGFATIGTVGYDGRWEYAAIGTVCNLSARLCSEAKSGQIIVSRRFVGRADGQVDFEELGERTLKGISKAVAVFNVLRLKES